MFKFLKKKLFGATEKISEEIEEEAPEEIVEEKVEETKEEPEKKGIIKKLKEKIVTKKISSDKFDKLFWDLEVVLLENNVAVEIIVKIKSDLKEKLVDQPIPRGNVSKIIEKSLSDSIKELFVDNIDFISEVKKKKPYVICFLGINGSGKTTTIAKIANLLKKNGLSCVLAAGDTFRAAGITQLQEWGKKVDVKVIAHDYGADSAAVCWDSIKMAKARGIDVVLIDTAGRQHSDINLMNELNKIVRIANPDMKIFVGESITGNDMVEQSKRFNEEVGIDGIILTKADVDEKGGAMISVGYVTKKPILYLSTGQNPNDLKLFDKEEILKNLGF